MLAKCAHAIELDREHIGRAVAKEIARMRPPQNISMLAY